MATQKEAGARGRATIRDIAELAGVSVATVSRVINDRPDIGRRYSTFDRPINSAAHFV